MRQKFIAERLSQLVSQSNMSEYKISCELGQSKGYINKIISGSIYPSMTVFFAICEYFHLTPAEFFAPYQDEETTAIMEIYQELSGENQETAEKILKALLAAQKSEK